jgi:aspartate/methionine/tyrosine aminotransferase
MHPRVEPNRFDKIMTPPITEITDLADELERQGQSVIRSTGQGVPFTKPPAYALDQISKVIFQEKSIHSYSPDPGFLEVREALSSYLRTEFSLNTHADDLFLTVGANMAFYMLVTALLESNRDEILFLSPYYFNHIMAVQMAGGKQVLAQSSHGFELDPNAIASKVTENTRAIVCISPNNPTGAVYSKRSFEALSEIFKEHNDVLLISDETYANFVYGKNQHCSPGSLLPLKEVTCTIGSCSKNFGLAGWRLGWLHLPPVLENLFGSLLKIQDTTNIAPPTVSQRLFQAILQGPYKAYLNRTKELLERNWRFVVEWMQSADEDLGFTFPQNPQGAFYLFVGIPNPGDSKKFARELLQEEGVATIPGMAFGKDGYLRISYGGHFEEANEAFMRLENFAERKMGK